ncbi:MULTISPECIES: glycoside hydrolase family 3 protein [unclassified Streptomyces]|uniref:glycoside hydrolase family 3 protein n=1 Tax=unclassified Streptomyces TaxID=2593676 RepID=UPI0001C1CFCB|nr:MULTISPECIES: glycoside hydrolase family 3 protein [unclassified Streptomyces]MYR67017.1 glycoside hydrolase family 3 protein [Streptomyces sp. SID4939]MYS02036.1 glycoside hydrolase family 3 protein [Streptomyces sp. SID4940]MYT66091.1 glycoside hydrolase family 3 protein [Streptomyces sp. SID8357]MYT88153.1 glycoside hydrolase family 3 protein [Streptomyces sp. SID8360]MYW37602.1 glycoside hydrolase family 3 protein [Streptomyces sp. SID1]MYX74107.1 glycoside hydrolase family 3 protein [
MHHRTSRRTLLTATAATAVAAATGVVAVPGAAQASGTSTDSRLKRLIARMSLEEKVGQLFVMRVYGHSATAPDQADIDANLDEIGVRTAAELISTYHVGGIIYFTWAHNTRDPHQIADLSNGIQRAGLAQPTPVPLLVSTDQEHGIVCRVGEPATLLPGAMALGAGGSRSDTREAARIAGAELAALGINQNYAPDADVNVNPANPVIGVRSFGSDPQSVAGLVTAQVKGYQGAGVASTAKHFPGHGDTSTDSHTGLPSILHTRQEWAELDAPPFRAAVAAGIDSIMTAHIVVPALDPSEDPATLSRPILTGILREELGYDGVVVTDSLGMEGVRTKYGDERVPVLALQAGVDQLLNPPDLSVAWNAVLEAVRSGEITEARIEESILRILRLKSRLGLFRDPYVTHRGVDRTVGTREHLAAADRVAERTTTLLAHPGRLLPLSRRTHRDVLVVGADPASPSGTTGPPTTTLADAFRELGFTATALPTGTAPSQATIDQAVAAAAGRDAVVVATYNVTASSSQRTLVGALAATGVPVITLAIRNPYDIAHLADTGYAASLAAYSWTDVELRAAVRVIAGRARPKGRLPVPVQRADVPAQTLYPVGHGLSY